MGKHSDLFFASFVRRRHGASIGATGHSVAVVGNPLVDPIFELAQAGHVIKVGKGLGPPDVAHSMVDGFDAAGETAVFIYEPRFAQPVLGREAQFSHAFRDELPPLDFKLSFGPRLHETCGFLSETAVGIVDEEGRGCLCFCVHRQFSCGRWGTAVKSLSVVSKVNS